MCNFVLILGILGKHYIKTTAYHPASNDIVERFHRSLNASLICHDIKWTKALLLVLLGLQTTIKEDISTSASDLVYGTPLRLPDNIFDAITSNQNNATAPTSEYSAANPHSNPAVRTHTEGTEASKQNSFSSVLTRYENSYNHPTRAPSK